VNPTIAAALIGLAGVVFVQLVGVIIWAVMIEMRMRACESTCREMREVRDIVLSLRDGVGRIREDLTELNANLRRLTPGYEPDARSNWPRKPQDA
jgi:hypothetical protein